MVMLRVGGGASGDAYSEGAVGDAPADADAEGAAGDAMVDGAAGDADGEGAAGGLTVDGAAGDVDGEGAAGEGSGFGSVRGWSLAGVGRRPSQFLAEGLLGGVAGQLARQSC